MFFTYSWIGVNFPYSVKNQQLLSSTIGLNKQTSKLITTKGNGSKKLQIPLSFSVRLHKSKKIELFTCGFQMKNLLEFFKLK